MMQRFYRVGQKNKSVIIRKNNPLGIDTWKKEFLVIEFELEFNLKLTKLASSLYFDILF